MTAAASNIRALNQRLGAPGRLAAILLIVAIVVLLVSVRSLGRAVLAPSAKEVKNSQDEKIKQLAGEYSASLAQQSAQFTGRSVFFIPSPPVPKPPPPEPVVAKDPEPPAPPPKPAAYGGPKLIAMVNDEVWFDDGQKLIAGADGKDGLKIKELKPPWDVAVVWKDVDFNVSLFDRDKVVFPAPKPPGAPSSADAPAAAEPKETTNPSDAPKPSESPKPEGSPDPDPGPGEPVAPKPAEPTDPKSGDPKPIEPKPADPKPETPPAPVPTPPKPDQP
jgi:hypothetical protein